MLCPNCGANNPDGALRCSQCKAQLNGNQQPANQGQYRPGEVLARASLAFGIFGLIIFFVLGFVLGPLSIIWGKRAKRRGYAGGVATAGIILGIVDLAAWLASVIFVIWLWMQPAIGTPPPV